jgi:hypothetical protein
MQRSFLPVVIFIVVNMNSCSSNESRQNLLPAAPSSIKAVLQEVKGKKYKADKAGTHSLIPTDKEIEWLEPKKEDDFQKKIVDESKSLELNFINDTSIIVIVKDKMYTGTYSADTVTKENEKPGIKLRISYADEEFRFGDTPASTVTFTYTIEGINDNSLLLETARSMNERKIVVLMKKQ